MATQLNTSADSTTYFPVIMGNWILMDWWQAGQLLCIEVERNFSELALTLMFKFKSGATHTFTIRDDRWLDGDVKLTDEEIATLYMYVGEA